MQLRNIGDLLGFIIYMKHRHISFELDHSIHSAVTALIFLPGKRIEVSFYEDEVGYNIFSGDESVEDDFGKLFTILERATK